MGNHTNFIYIILVSWSQEAKSLQQATKNKFLTGVGILLVSIKHTWFLNQQEETTKEKVVMVTLNVIGGVVGINDLFSPAHINQNAFK